MECWWWKIGECIMLQPQLILQLRCPIGFIWSLGYGIFVKQLKLCLGVVMVQEAGVEASIDEVIYTKHKALPGREGGFKNFLE